MKKMRHFYIATVFFKEKLIKQCEKHCVWICSMKYLFIIPSLSLKYNFHRWKTVDLPLAAAEVRQILSWSKYQSIPFKNIWVIVRKQNFNQNLILIVDAARHTDQRQSFVEKSGLKFRIHRSVNYLIFEDPPNPKNSGTILKTMELWFTIDWLVDRIMF